MTSREYMDTMLKINETGSEIAKKIRSTHDLVRSVCSHTGVIEGYLYAATPSQIIDDPETLDLFINHLGDLTGALSTKAAELAQSVPELKTLINAARGLADREGVGNVEE